MDLYATFMDQENAYDRLDGWGGSKNLWCWRKVAGIYEGMWEKSKAEVRESKTGETNWRK